MSKKAVVIGAGQTGRGYVARYLVEKNYDISFIDINQDLIDYLREDNSFAIHFYHKDRSPLMVKDFAAYHVSDENVKNVLSEADLILTSTGEQNLGEVSDLIVKHISEKEKETVFITCENGTNPAKVLRNHLVDRNFGAPYRVSQTAVFCSTVSILETRLDILSQNETYFPFDHDELDELDFHGAVPVKNFEKFFERKIYTYNCLAGLISYCGYIKGYEVYGDSANDADVSATMDRLLESLNPALQEYFEITEEDQVSFANKALDKFKDEKILDYNIKNGRAPKRKLGPTERIMSPIRIIEIYNHFGEVKILEFVAAAALVYWVELEGKSEPLIGRNPIEEFASINSLSMDDELVKNVTRYFNEIMNNRDNINILEIVDK